MFPRSATATEPSWMEKHTLFPKYMSDRSQSNQPLWNEVMALTCGNIF